MNCPPSRPYCIGAHGTPYCRVYVELVHKSERLFLVHPERSRVAAKSKDNASIHGFDADATLQKLLAYGRNDVPESERSEQATSTKPRQDLTQDAEPFTHMTELCKLVGCVIRIHATKAGDLYVEAVALQEAYIGQTTSEGEGLSIRANRGNRFSQCQIPRRSAVAGDTAGGRSKLEFYRAGRLSQVVAAGTEHSQLVHIQLIDECEGPLFDLLR